jgi:hypothetical protein
MTTSSGMSAALAVFRAGRTLGLGDNPAAAAAAVALGVYGITAAIGTGQAGAAVAWGAGGVSAEVEGMQFTLGQGRGIDTIAAVAPILVPGLAHDAWWPIFTPAAVALGVGAIFAFPLRIGAIGGGALLAHRTTPGPLGRGGLTDALALAEAVTGVLLKLQNPAEPETYRAQVHQATGMTSVHLGVSLGEALALLRAHAFAADRFLADVADDVVARRLRLETP